MQKVVDILDERLENIKGVGKKRATMLAKAGLYTFRDMLYYLPRDYKDFSKITPAAALEEGEGSALVRLSEEARVAYPKRGLSIVSAAAHDETGKVKLLWYNQPFRKKQLKAGAVYLVYGRVAKKGRTVQFENPEIEEAENLGEGVSPRGILPVYPLRAGVGQKTMRSAARACLDKLSGRMPETIPGPLREKYGMAEINCALENVHFPASEEDLERARHRLSMEELLHFLLAVEEMKRERMAARGIAFAMEGTLDAFLRHLPFEPTEAQRKVLGEIAADMGKEEQMNRLVQGDVGSGKTVLAMYALYVAVKNGYQGAMMAPTEILARQHADSIQSLFGNEWAVGLLVGSMTAKQKREIYGRLASGEIDVVVGTHALIQQGVDFANLGVVIADEQHRFGVKQRGALSQNRSADVLVMSATPIPRTLTLILYGDLDISVLSGMPPGRKPVLTRLVPQGKREDMFRFLATEAGKGGQSYIVCPVIEESDESSLRSAEALYAALKSGVLKDSGVALLHGRMKGDEKEGILEEFRRGNTKALVSTTVVEVGVDVPNANIMVIEDADRFGLAQLHQLRGRVGRGQQQSWCFLLTNSQSESALARLKILCESNDGFEIAQKDLELRGPGEFLGTRQSGGMQFKLLSIIENMESVEQARDILAEMERNPDYGDEWARMAGEMRRVYERELQDIALN